jgi:hypothetical protein
MLLQLPHGFDNSDVEDLGYHILDTWDRPKSRNEKERLLVAPPPIYRRNIITDSSKIPGLEIGSVSSNSVNPAQSIAPDTIKNQHIKFGENLHTSSLRQNQSESDLIGKKKRIQKSVLSQPPPVSPIKNPLRYVVPQPSHRSDIYEKQLCSKKFQLANKIKNDVDAVRVREKIPLCISEKVAVHKTFVTTTTTEDVMRFCDDISTTKKSASTATHNEVHTVDRSNLSRSKLSSFDDDVTLP